MFTDTASVDRWLAGLLSEGPLPAGDVLRAGAAVGLYERRLYRSAKRLRVLRDGHTWSLQMSDSRQTSPLTSDRPAPGKVSDTGLPPYRGESPPRPTPDIPPAGPWSATDGASRIRRARPIKGAYYGVWLFDRWAWFRRTRGERAPLRIPQGFEPIDGPAVAAVAWRFKGPGQGPAEAPLTGAGVCVSCGFQLGRDGRLVFTGDDEHPNEYVAECSPTCPGDLLPEPPPLPPPPGPAVARDIEDVAP